MKNLLISIRNNNNTKARKTKKLSKNNEKIHKNKKEKKRNKKEILFINILELSKNNNKMKKQIQTSKNNNEVVIQATHVIVRGNHQNNKIPEINISDIKSRQPVSTGTSKQVATSVKNKESYINMLDLSDNYNINLQEIINSNNKKNITVIKKKSLLNETLEKNQNLKTNHNKEISKDIIIKKNKDNNKEGKIKVFTSKEISNKNSDITKENLNFKENLNLLSNNVKTQGIASKRGITSQRGIASQHSGKTFEAVKTQLENSITYMSQNNKKQVVLKLNPEHLGKVEINISMIKKNTKVEIKVQKHETLELLSNNQTSLKDLFSAIKKTGNEVSFSFDRNTNSESNQENNRKKHKKYTEINEKFNYSENESISNYAGLIEVIV